MRFDREIPLFFEECPGTERRLRTRYFVEKNCYPDIHAEFAQRIMKYKNPYAEQKTKRYMWIPASRKLPKKAEVLYFVGCTSALRSPEIAKSTFQLLGNANIDFTVLPEEICCGSIMLRTGNTEIYKRLAEKNIEMIEASGASTIVFSYNYSIMKIIIQLL